MARPGNRNHLAQAALALLLLLIAVAVLMVELHGSSADAEQGDTASTRSSLNVTYRPPATKSVRAGNRSPFRLWVRNSGQATVGPVRVCLRVKGLSSARLPLKNRCNRFETIPSGSYQSARWILEPTPDTEGKAILLFRIYVENRVTWKAKTRLHILPVAPKPDIRNHLIPFGGKRKHQMARYSKRHYGKADWRLRHPKQIVEHYAVASTLGQIFNVFRSDRPDPEYGELPNVCAHFAVDANGRIQQFVSLRIRCRHVVGLNYVAIGIEHTGFSDGQVLSDRRQMRASLKLTQWLRCRYSIKVRDVIGHRESLSSRFYRERVRSMRGQTHGDFRHSSMQRYRHRLRVLGPC